MGKSSKKSATKVEAAPAAIKPTEPLKNSKRDAEDDLEAKLDLKKQKKDVIAAVKLPKKVESSSDSEEQHKAKKVPAKAASSSDEDDSSDYEPAPEEDSSSEEDESSDESSDEEMVDGEQKSNAKQPKTPSTPSTGGGNTLFAANLSFQIERSDIENFFKEAGQVVDVRLGTSKDDGRFMGFGHVEFATAEDAQKALELNGKPLLGRDIRLEVAVERGERPAYTPQSGNGGGQTIFVKGFDSSLGEDDIKKALREHFSSCGEMSRVSVPIDRDTGASKGIAYIDFKEGAEEALKLNGSDMGGWNIVVEEAKQRRENGGRFSGGGRRGGRGRDGGGRGRFGSGGRGRGKGRDGGRGRPSFTPSGKKTTFSDE